MLITGTFGIGKSAVVKSTGEDIAKERGREYCYLNNMSNEDKEKLITENRIKDYFFVMDMRLSEFDATDIRGLPDFDRLRRWVEWKYPFFVEILSHPDSDGLLFFDEFNLATDLTLKACYKILHDKIINDTKINYNWLIIGAGNTDEDRSNTTEIAPPIRDRCAEMILIPPTPKEWIKWATKYGLSPKIIAYLSWKGTSLRKVDLDKANKYTTERCLKGDSEILLSNGITKKIKDIVIDDKVLGINNGEIVVSKVLKTFKKEVDKQYTIKTSTKEITSSEEHGFLTDIGYVQAKNLNKKFTTQLYGFSKEMETIGKKFSEKELGYDQRTISKKAKSISKFDSLSIKSYENKEIEDCSKRIFDTNNDGFELFSRFIRWGRKYILFKTSSQKEKQSFILRTATDDRQLLCFIQGLVYQYKFSVKRGKKGKSHLAGQIPCPNIWYEDKMVIRIIDTLLKDEKTCRFINDRVSERNGKARKEKSKKIGKVEKSSQIIKYKSKEKIISIRKKNNKEIFYDLMTSTQNYIANGFIVHNSWERVNCFMNCPIDEIDLVAGTCMGEDIASEFLGFLRIEGEINLEDIIKSPEKLRGLTDAGKKYFVVSGLAEKYKENLMSFEQLFAVSTILEEIKSAEFVALLWRLSSRMNKTKFRKDFTTKELKHPLRAKFLKYLTDE